MNDLQKKIERGLEMVREDPQVNDNFNLFDEWKKKHIQEFHETKKSLKHIFKSEGLALPKNWDELFLSWIWNAPIGSKIREVMGSTIKERKISKLEPIPKEYFIRWAKEETSRLKEILKEPEAQSGSPGKGEANAVKYLLLDHFFDLKSEFKELLTKDKDNLLGFILGCRADTARNIKNNSGKSKPDGKHITEKALERFTELSEKIKKGEIL